MSHILKIKATLLIVAILLSFSTLGCDKRGGQGTETGGPPVVDPVDPEPPTGSPEAIEFALYMDALNSGTVQVSFCLVTVVTKGDPAVGDVTFDLPVPQWADLAVVRTLMANVEGISGTYSALDLNIDNQCGEASSLRIVNSFGTFSIDSFKKMTFIGSRRLERETDEVELGFAAIENFLNNVTSPMQLADEIEDQRGQF